MDLFFSMFVFSLCCGGWGGRGFPPSCGSRGGLTDTDFFDPLRTGGGGGTLAPEIPEDERLTGGGGG